MRSHCVFVVHSDRTAVSFQTENPVLAYLSIALGGAISGVVVEERVESCTVDGDAARIHDSETPAICCWDGVISLFDGLLWKLGIMKTSNVRERKRSTGIWLIVCRLCLDLRHPC